MKRKPLKRELPIGDSKGDPEAEQEQRLSSVIENPRDKAFINLLKTSAMRISEVTQLNETDINFKSGTLTIVHLKERSKLKCPLI